MIVQIEITYKHELLAFSQNHVTPNGQSAPVIKVDITAQINQILLLAIDRFKQNTKT